jgi:hypothetical protein
MFGRILSTVSVLALVAWGMAGCGAGGGSAEIVARVEGVGGISKAMLDHWIPVEAAVLYQERPVRPVPKGVIPDPPRYDACIAYLGSVRQTLLESGPALSPTQLRQRCAKQYGQLRVLTLNTLITWYWALGTGKRLGMTATDAEVRRWLADTYLKDFPSSHEYARYLDLTGQTSADMMLRGRVQLLEEKFQLKQRAIERRLPKGITPQQRRPYVDFASVLPKAWAARTTCRRGYVVSACREYRGPLAPGVPN